MSDYDNEIFDWARENKPTNKRFISDHAKSDTVSMRLQRLARLLQLNSPDAIIQQEIAALQRELGDASMIVTVHATVEVKK